MKDSDEESVVERLYSGEGEGTEILGADNLFFARRRRKWSGLTAEEARNEASVANKLVLSDEESVVERI